MAKLVDRLTEIYDYIEAYKARCGYSPALEEIGQALAIDRGAVFHHLETMENLGMIVRPRGYLQAIKLVSRQPDWGARAAEG
jgi:SOS-response transcriptional repressor LexA